MQTFFQELFTYTHQMNQRWIALFAANPEKVTEKSLKWLSHTLNAQHIWNHRLMKKDANYGVWQIHKIEDLAEVDKANFEETMRILTTISVEEVILYSNTKGESFQNSVKDILFHLVNHSTYHRGQIASDCKQAGIEPLLADYIFYKREN